MTENLLIYWMPLIVLIGVWVILTRQQRNRLSGPSGASYGEMLATFLGQQERLIAQQDRLNRTLEAAVTAQEARIARLEGQLATRS
jgi:hypothetical protein